MYVVCRCIMDSLSIFFPSGSFVGRSFIRSCGSRYFDRIRILLKDDRIINPSQIWCNKFAVYITFKKRISLLFDIFSIIITIDWNRNNIFFSDENLMIMLCWISFPFVYVILSFFSICYLPGDLEFVSPLIILLRPWYIFFWIQLKASFDWPSTYHVNHLAGKNALLSEDCNNIFLMVISH